MASLVKKKHHRRAPCPFGRSFAQLLAIFRLRAKRPRCEKPWVRTRIVLLRPSVPERRQNRSQKPRSQKPRPGISGLGHYRPKCPTRFAMDWHVWLLILLSNTPQTKWCCVGSPRPIFAVIPFVVYRGRRAMFLCGAVYDGRKGHAF